MSACQASIHTLDTGVPLRALFSSDGSGVDGVHHTHTRVTPLPAPFNALHFPLLVGLFMSSHTSVDSNDLHLKGYTHTHTHTHTHTQTQKLAYITSWLSRLFAAVLDGYDKWGFCLKANPSCVPLSAQMTVM